MRIPLFQIDAFAEGPFTGNPAAVCLMEGEAPDGWLQALAAENNLSETAYCWRLAPQPPEGPAFRLRWFTPVSEVDLCGHATLATAHALWSAGWLPAGETARFDTLSGRLEARQLDGGWIALDFPALPVEPTEPPAGLLEAIGVDRPLFVGRNRQDVLIELPDEAAVRAVAPDMKALARISTRGTIVTAPAGERTEADFVSRFFAPAEGIDEDPVTGSAHCGLGPYWSAKLGRTDLVGWQASRRGGTVRVRVAGERVQLSGRAVTVIEGQVVLPPSPSGLRGTGGA